MNRRSLIALPGIAAFAATQAFSQTKLERWSRTARVTQNAG